METNSNPNLPPEPLKAPGEQAEQPASTQHVPDMEMDVPVEDVFIPCASSYDPSSSALQEPLQKPKYPWTTRQRAVIRSIARLHDDVIVTDENLPSIRQATVITESKLPQWTVDGTFQKLVDLGYLRRHSAPNGRKATYYKITGTGVRFLAEQSSCEEPEPETEQKLPALNTTADAGHEAQSEPPVDPDRVFDVFEQSRDQLAAISRRLLLRYRLDPSLADDALNDAVLNVYDRFVLRGEPIGAESLQKTLYFLARDRTMSIVRYELAIASHIANEQTTHNDGTNLDGELTGEVPSRVEEAMQRNSTVPPAEEQALRNVYYADQFFTLLARMLLAMTEVQRDALFGLCKESMGEKVPQNAIPEGTLKSRRRNGRKHALEYVTWLVGPHLAQTGKEDLTPKEAIEAILAQTDALELSPRLYMQDSPPVIEMKKTIINVLYPNGEAKVE